MSPKWFWLLLGLFTLVAGVSSLKCYECSGKVGPTCEPQKRITSCPNETYHCFWILDNEAKDDVVVASGCGHPAFLKKLGYLDGEATCDLVNGDKIMEYIDSAKVPGPMEERSDQWANDKEYSYRICDCHKDLCNKDGASSMELSKLIVGVVGTGAIGILLIGRM